MPMRLVAAIIGAAVGVLVIEPLLDRSQPYERTNGRIVPDNPRRGTQVQVEFDVITWRRCPGDATRHIVDGNGMDHDYATHEAIIVDIPKDSPTLQIPFVLPAANEKATEKLWTYYADMRYWCNWTQRIWPIKARTPLIKFVVKP